MRKLRDPGGWHIGRLPLTARRGIDISYDARASMGSRIDGSSFSGLFTRVEIGHMRIRSDGNDWSTLRSVSPSTIASLTGPLLNHPNAHAGYGDGLRGSGESGTGRIAALQRTAG